MGKGIKCLAMEVCIKGSIEGIKWMELGNMCGILGKFIRGNGKII